MTNSYQAQHAVLDALVQDGPERAQAVTALRTYFHEPAADQHELATFTGRRFERLDGGGDRSDVASVVTAADVLALTLLKIGGELGWLGLDLLENRAAEICEYLARVPQTAMHLVSTDEYDA
ncbi:MAG TPA: DUF6308 family protein, partial [Pseudonocardiaceae bacterium]|nr:DUF6308 family protein [Pseudonocardiaceae bacterium]